MQEREGFDPFCECGAQRTWNRLFKSNVDHEGDNIKGKHARGDDISPSSPEASQKSRKAVES